MPARTTLSPISIQAAWTVSLDRVTVPGKGEMLARLADRLDGQEDHWQIRRQQRHHAGKIALHDHCIRPERQMRPVLLDGRDRQNRDDARHIGGGKILPAVFFPVSLQHERLWSIRRLRAGIALDDRDIGLRAAAPQLDRGGVFA